MTDDVMHLVRLFAESRIPLFRLNMTLGKYSKDEVNKILASENSDLITNSLSELVDLMNSFKKLDIVDAVNGNIQPAPEILTVISPGAATTTTSQLQGSKKAKQDDYFDVLLLKTLSTASDTTSISLPKLQKVALQFDEKRKKHSITSKLTRWRDGSSPDGKCAEWKYSNFRKLTPHGVKKLAEKQKYLKCPDKKQKIIDIIQQVIGERVIL